MSFTHTATPQTEVAQQQQQQQGQQLQRRRGGRRAGTSQSPQSPHSPVEEVYSEGYLTGQTMFQPQVAPPMPVFAGFAPGPGPLLLFLVRKVPMQEIARLVQGSLLLRLSPVRRQQLLAPLLLRLILGFPRHCRR